MEKQGVARHIFLSWVTQIGLFEKYAPGASSGGTPNAGCTGLFRMVIHDES